MFMIRNFNLFLWLGTLALGAGTCWAGGVSTPFSFSSAQVLPKGVRSVRYSHLSSRVNRLYDQRGKVISLASEMNAEVTYKDLIKEQKDPLERGLLAGFVSSLDRDINQSIGKTTGEVDIQIKAHVPVLAWGILKNWTAAVAFPIIELQSAVDTGFVAYDELQSVANILIKKGAHSKARELRKKSADPISDKIESYGYDSLERESKTGLGDVVIANRIAIKNTENYRLTFLSDLTLPTGEGPNPNKIIDTPFGDGQFDLGFGAAMDYLLFEKLKLTGKLNYTWQIADTVTKRVPESSSSKLSSDLDQNVKRNLGDIIYAGTGMSWKFIEGLNLNFQYAFQYKKGNRYRGQLFSPQRYEFIDWDGRKNQELHTLQAGVSYSTVPLFLRKSFAIPLDIHINGGFPLSGKNTIKSTVIAAEFSTYF